jgi:hypothetical protein
LVWLCFCLRQSNDTENIKLILLSIKD